jgi:hypothetical protein
VPFKSKIDLKRETIQSFEPVAGTLTHVVLDSWYSAKVIWKAARERQFLMTTGGKSNRCLRVEDASQPTEWHGQPLND